MSLPKPTCPSPNITNLLPCFKNRNTMNELVPQADYEKIARMIASDNSVVGIDAKETHIIIIHKLMEIEKRLESLEKAVKK